MRFLRVNTECDVLNTADRIVVYNNVKKKRIQFRATLEAAFIMDLLSNRAYTRKDIYEKARNNKKLSLDKIMRFIDAMIEIEVIDVVEVLSNKNNNLYPELIYGDRYAMEIASFKKYENNNINRFEIFERIRDTEIVVVGLGGIGSYISVMLAALGVGKLKLIDGDIVEKSNLPRQIFYKERDCGFKHKVNALRDFINTYNNEIEVESIARYIKCRKDAIELITKTNYKNIVVIQTANEPMGEIQHILNYTCVKKSIPILFVNASTVGPFYIPNQSACYMCMMNSLYESNKKVIQEIRVMKNNRPNKYPASIMGVIEGANVVMSEIYLFLMGKQPNSLNAIVNIESCFDRMLPEFKIIKIKRKEGCICGN